MICFPNAKINLGLNIVRKRPDGYHDIETVFYPIPVKDALEVTSARHDEFHASGVPVGVPAEKNLVMKALNELRKYYPIPGLNVGLLKTIPFGAGLGGGSADAAFMLQLVNEFCQLHVPSSRLEEIAASIGADCPFFIRNTPVFASGIGNVFEPSSVDLHGWHLCLVKPDVFVSTAAAYSKVIPAKPSRSLKEIMSMPVERWKEMLINDFERSVFSEFPAIRAIKDKLYASGAAYASMSGSGSSVFGLFKEATQLEETFPGCFVWEGAL